MKQIYKALIVGLGFGWFVSFALWATNPCYYHTFEDITWFQGQYPFCQSRSGQLALQPIPIYGGITFGGMAFAWAWFYLQTPKAKVIGDKSE